MRIGRDHRGAPALASVQLVRHNPARCSRRRYGDAELSVVQKPTVAGFYDERTGSIQYVAACPATKLCALVDPVLDFDAASGATATASADALLAYVRDHGLTVQWVFDTHPHADHVSAAQYLKEKTGAPTAIGARIVDVQALWAKIYGWPDMRCDGSQWDKLFDDGERFRLGEIDGHVLFSPGHTMASITYVIGDAAFVHDTLFMPDSGTARTDFPGGSATDLYGSIERILSLPEATRVFVGHDYKQGGRPARWESTVAEQRASNTHFASGPSLGEFVRVREARDRTLPLPRLILHALQINIQAGRLPQPDACGRRYLRFPLDALPGTAWS